MKKSILTASLAVGGAALAAAACAVAAKFRLPKAKKQINLDDFTLAFEDDFNGTAIDTSKWSTDQFFESDHTYIRRGGYWDGDQVKLDGKGNLHITTEYKADGKYGPGWYTGVLHTNGKYTLRSGYCEARCKAPKAQGLWAAFWLLADTMPDPTDGGRNGAEIDVFESPFYNDPKMHGPYKNAVFHTLHVDGYGDDHKAKMSPYYMLRDIHDTFHTYGVYWDADTYIFYVDGKETWRTSWQGTPRVEEYMILSVEIAGKDAVPDNRDGSTWSGQITNNPAGTFPADFVVDYVRVYQPK